MIERAEGVWVYDVEGKRYLDCLGVVLGGEPGTLSSRNLKTLVDQAHKVTLTSRAFRNDQLPLLYKELHDLTGMDMMLPMNSGAEAVETAVKTARKWGYKVKGIPEGRPRSSSAPTISMGARSPSSAFRAMNNTATASAPSPPASRSFLSETPAHYAKPSLRIPALSCRADPRRSRDRDSAARLFAGSGQHLP